MRECKVCNIKQKEIERLKEVIRGCEKEILELHNEVEKAEKEKAEMENIVLKNEFSAKFLLANKDLIDDLIKSEKPQIIKSEKQQIINNGNNCEMEGVSCVGGSSYKKNYY